MKKLLNVLSVGIFLVSCTGTAESDLQATDSPENSISHVDTTQVMSSTTVPLIQKSLLPRIVECPLQKISLETSEVFKDVIRCVDGWAVGIPQRFVEKFNGDTDVEAEWVLTNKPGMWTVVGVCHIYHPIYSAGPICNNPYNDNPINLSLIPPMPVQCVLWDGAKFSEKISETGCPNAI